MASDLADPVQVLPVTESPLSPNESVILDTLFPTKYNVLQQVFLGTKDVIAVAILFALISLPGVDNLVERFVPMTKGAPYLILLVKTLIFALGYFIVKNSYLVRRK
jgi:hypothetical protein